MKKVPEVKIRELAEAQTAPQTARSSTGRWVRRAELDVDGHALQAFI